MTCYTCYLLETECLDIKNCEKMENPIDEDDLVSAFKPKKTVKIKAKVLNVTGSSQPSPPAKWTTARARQKRVGRNDE